MRSMRSQVYTHHCCQDILCRYKHCSPIAYIDCMVYDWLKTGTCTLHWKLAWSLCTYIHIETTLSSYYMYIELIFHTKIQKYIDACTSYLTHIRTHTHTQRNHNGLDIRCKFHFKHLIVMFITEWSTKWVLIPQCHYSVSFTITEAL